MSERQFFGLGSSAVILIALPLGSSWAICSSFGTKEHKTSKGIVGPVRAWAAYRPSSVESRLDALHASGLTELVGQEETRTAAAAMVESKGWRRSSGVAFNLRHRQVPFNTAGGGLCNNHPAHHVSMTKVLEAVRQLCGEAHPAVQVKNCDFALAQGTGFQLARRHGSATMMMERE